MSADAGNEGDVPRVVAPPAIAPGDEDALLRSVALQNAQAILLARQRAEQDLRAAKTELETKTEELARSVSALRATLEATTDGILVTDDDRRVTGFNRRYVEMWGVPETLMAAGDRFAIVDACLPQLKDPDGFVRRIREIDATSPDESFDTIELADGRVYERYSRIQFVENRRVGRVWSFRDATERLRTERKLIDEARNLELLNRTGAAIAGELDLARVLQIITDAATELSGAEFGAFFYNVTEANGDAYMLYTLSGAPREAFERLGHPRATEIFGPTFRGEGTIRIDDVLTDPRYGRMPPHYGMPKGHLPVRSYLAVPVISRDANVLGGLFFAHSRTGVFTERSERLVAGIAGQAAVAIDNARLYDAAHRAAREREHLLEAERAARASAERMSSLKDDFLATLSHELRTPLSAILGWSQVLRLKSAGPAEIGEGLQTIERNARIQIQLIEDLLDMSRITSGKLRLDVQPVEPATFVESAMATVRPAADAKGVRLEAILDPSAGPISGDPNRLQQVVWNLLSNAIKFTPKGGKVQVRLERVNSHIEITVADTGAGIRAEFLPHVFERFRQADSSMTRTHGGLGLGLSIVKHLVEMHGGTARVSSPGEDQGATFVIELPLTVVHSREYRDGRAHPSSLATSSSDFTLSDLSRIKVLVVDDEPDARQLIKRLLDECGASVVTAADAAAALALIERERPDILVSDVGMPGANGYELLSQVRSLGPARGGNVPAIALTAFARSEDRTRALRAGFLAHVAKPVEPSELVATVASVVGRTGPA
jgi:signal transduction histidine kinase/PAS domain-containing protein/ActR/RegA family two-component response regulator